MRGWLNHLRGILADDDSLAEDVAVHQRRVSHPHGLADAAHAQQQSLAPKLALPQSAECAPSQCMFFSISKASRDPRISRRISVYAHTVPRRPRKHGQGARICYTRALSAAGGASAERRLSLSPVAVLSPCPRTRHNLFLPSHLRHHTHAIHTPHSPHASSSATLRLSPPPSTFLPPAMVRQLTSRACP